jgi:hypothetical protein
MRVFLTLAALVIVVGVPVAVCALKRRWVGAGVGLAVLVGAPLLLQIGRGLEGMTLTVVSGALLVAFAAWLVPLSKAIDLAHPMSWWARRFYSAEKRRRAEARQAGLPASPGHYPHEQREPRLRSAAAHGSLRFKPGRSGPRRRH